MRWFRIRLPRLAREATSRERESVPPALLHDVVRELHRLHGKPPLDLVRGADDGPHHAIDDLRMGVEQRLEAAASQRRYAQEQYDSERRRFDSGISTVFLVLERQTAFVTAQASELRARADLNQAIAQLERAIGGTLEWHGVKLGQ